MYDYIIPYTSELPQWNVTSQASASLNFSFALVEGIKSFKLDYQSGMITYEKAKLQIERDVRKAYNNIQLLRQLINVDTDRFTTAQKQYEMTQSLYNAGLAPRLQVLQAQVQVENLKPQMASNKNNLQMATANFAMSLGLPLDTVFEFEDTPETAFDVPLDVQELIGKASSGKIDILELQAQARYLASARKAQAMQNYTPYLAFNYGISSMMNPTLNPWKENWFKNDNWNGGGNFSVTLGFSLNSFLPFTKEGQALKDTDNQIKALNIGLAQLVQGTELEIYNAVNSLNSAKTSAEASKLTVDMAQDAYNQTEEAYRAGLQDLLQVESARDSLAQARLAVLQQQFTYMNGLLDLEYSVGVPFGTLSENREQRTENKENGE
jgi:outer membrane protein TolC